MKRIFIRLMTIENNLEAKMSETVGLIREVVIMGDAKEILVEINKDFYRPAEVELLYGNADPAREQLGWKPEISFDKLVQRMVECDLELEHAKR